MWKTAALLFLPLALAAQEDVNRLLEGADALAATGKYAQAEPLIARALALATASSDPAKVVKVLDAMGAVERAEGKNADALASFERALGTLEKSQGAASAALIPHLKMAAGAYAAVGRNDQAEKQLLRAVAIREQTAPDSLDLANDYAELGGFYMVEQHYQQAEPRFVRAIALTERKLGLEDAGLVPLLDSLADAYIKQGEFPLAEAPLRRVVWISERTEGPAGVKLAPHLDKLGLLLYAMHRYGDAEVYYRRSLPIWEGSMGKTNPDLTEALDNLAVALAMQRKYADATPIYRRSLALREAATVQNLNNLGMSMEGAGDGVNAEKQFTLAVTLAGRIPALPGEQSVGETDLLSKALDNYATLLHELRRDAEAAKLEERIKALAKTTPQK